MSGAPQRPLLQRLRPAVALAALAAAAVPFAAAPATVGRAAGTQLDVYNLDGDAAALRITVGSGYATLVNPDVEMPRAGAGIAAGQVSAVVSPADPGDDVDAFPGLALPMAEGEVQQGAQKLPGPTGTFVGRVVQQVTPLNPVLTYPYEHAVAVYPNPNASGPQSASMGPDLSASDPSGAVSVDGATGHATAADSTGVADAGAGGAVTIAPLGIRIGRLSAQVTVRGGTGTVTTDSVSTLQDVDIDPPGLVPAAPSPALPGLPAPAPLPHPLLHIGSLVTSVHAERSAGASRAVDRPSVEIAGVTVAGQPAEIGPDGITLLQRNQSLQPVVDALNRLFALAAQGNRVLPPNPLTGTQTIPAAAMAGPTVARQLTHSGNEDTTSVTGLTLTMAATIPVPSSTSVPPQGPPSVSPTPVVVTVMLGNATAGAYGVSLPTLSLPPGGAGGGGGALSGGAAGALPPVVPPALTGPMSHPPAATGTGGAAGGGPMSRVGAFLNGLLGRRAMVALAALVELLLLATLVAAYRMASATRPRSGAGPGMDMV